jgi:serine/threonine-protein phosphatase PP1-1
MVSEGIPRPGPARLGPRAGLDEWLAEAKQCHYLPEHVMKQLCESVKECLMEGWFISLR